MEATNRIEWSTGFVGFHAGTVYSLHNLVMLGTHYIAGLAGGIWVRCLAQGITQPIQRMSQRGKEMEASNASNWPQLNNNASLSTEPRSI